MSTDNNTVATILEDPNMGTTASNFPLESEGTWGPITQTTLRQSHNVHSEQKPPPLTITNAPLPTVYDHVVIQPPTPGTSPTRSVSVPGHYLYGYSPIAPPEYPIQISESATGPERQHSVHFQNQLTNPEISNIRRSSSFASNRPYASRHFGPGPQDHQLVYLPKEELFVARDPFHISMSELNAQEPDILDFDQISAPDETVDYNPPRASSTPWSTHPRWMRFNEGYRTVSSTLYLNLLLRLPSLYFGRVAQIFDEAELSLNKLKEMVYETTTATGVTTDNWDQNRSVSRGRARSLNEVLEDNIARTPPAYLRLKKTWESFIDSSIREWQTFNILSALLLGAILSILQINAAAQDPIIRYTALSSLLCALISLVYGCMYIIRFEAMRKTYKAAEWALEARKSHTVIWWNIWVLLALPAIWLAWSLIMYIVCIMTFVWRTNAASNSPPASDLVFSDKFTLIVRLILSSVMGIGVLFAGLVLNTFGRYGTVMDNKWKRRIQRWQLARQNGQVQSVGGASSYYTHPFGWNPQRQGSGSTMFGQTHLSSSPVRRPQEISDSVDHRTRINTSRKASLPVPRHVDDLNVIPKNSIPLKFIPNDTHRVANVGPSRLSEVVLANPPSMIPQPGTGPSSLPLQINPRSHSPLVAPVTASPGLENYDYAAVLTEPLPRSSGPGVNVENTVLVTSSTPSVISGQGRNPVDNGSHTGVEIGPYFLSQGAEEDPMATLEESSSPSATSR